MPAIFPASSEYADFVLRIERPRDADGRELLNRGWDLLYAWVRQLLGI